MGADTDKSNDELYELGLWAEELRSDGVCTLKTISRLIDRGLKNGFDQDVIRAQIILVLAELRP